LESHPSCPPLDSVVLFRTHPRLRLPGPSPPEVPSFFFLLPSFILRGFPPFVFALASFRSFHPVLRKWFLCVSWFVPPRLVFGFKVHNLWGVFFPRPRMDGPGVRVLQLPLAPGSLQRCSPFIPPKVPFFSFCPSKVRLFLSSPVRLLLHFLNPVPRAFLR